VAPRLKLGGLGFCAGRGFALDARSGANQSAATAMKIAAGSTGATNATEIA
jgi:hypothetical protein